MLTWEAIHHFSKQFTLKEQPCNRRLTPSFCSSGLFKEHLILFLSLTEITRLTQPFHNFLAKFGRNLHARPWQYSLVLRQHTLCIFLTESCLSTLTSQLALVAGCTSFTRLCALNGPLISTPTATCCEGCFCLLIGGIQPCLGARVTPRGSWERLSRSVPQSKG